MTRALATTTGPAAQGAPALQTMLKSAGAAARTSQTIGIEWVYFARASMSQSTEAAKKLAKADSLQTALAIQTEYAKGAYERLTTQAATFRELYTTLATDMANDMANHMAKPFGAMAARKGM